MAASVTTTTTAKAMTMATLRVFDDDCCCCLRCGLIKAACCRTMWRRKHDQETRSVETMCMKQLAKQNAEKCYGNGNLCVCGCRCAAGQDAKRVPAAWGINGWWYLVVMALTLPPQSISRCCDAKRTFKFCSKGTSECCRRAVRWAGVGSAGKCTKCYQTIAKN